MKTIYNTKRARLQHTKTYGYIVTNYVKRVNGRPTAINFNDDYSAALKHYESIK